MQAFHFHPVIAGWFEQKFGSPTEPQERGWPSIQSGAHTLIAAPTGSGKTLAAFFASLDQLFCEGLNGELPDETRVLYVSPLKALSNDIHKNLEEPLTGIRDALLTATGRDIQVRSEVRTGDTSASRRLAMARKPPHILVTTPESLYLLLTSDSGRKLLGTVRTVIVDEIHAIVSSRRGSHLALSLERLAALVNGPLQRIGLSATQKPIEDVARFLVGTNNLDASGKARCEIVDFGYARKLDLAIELPGSALEAVMSNEIWTEVYHRLAELIEAHQTTLVFVNTRRLAERVTHHLGDIIGSDKVTSHHGSLAAKLRLDAENRLKRGELKALVATASLEMGIDIGFVDLVCQLGTTRSIATLLQRVGRAGHTREGLPKGRIFPLSRDELVECVAALRSIRKGELDSLIMPVKPLDLLAQQIVASAACEDWDERALYDTLRAAYPYRDLTWQEFQEVLDELTNGFSVKRGRRGALIHHDSVNHRIRDRRGARLVAFTSGGAIPDNADYRVVLEPGETFIGTVNEDFAVESVAGDIFQLGNASWKILGINSGAVRVEDAHGQPPGIPFWLGEGPSRTAELSFSVSELRREIEEILNSFTKRGTVPPLPKGKGRGEGEGSEASLKNKEITNYLAHEKGLPTSGAQQLADYFSETYKSLGVIPSQNKIVLERFFDESGGMQLVIHSPFGIRVNRAWGLALRKRFCRSFNFELQAAATDDAIVLSLGTQHSFPLDDVFHYLNSKTVRSLLTQALLDAPMFPIRWRWNATRALALPRFRHGHKIAAPLQRMESENLLSAVFPDQLACLENIVGDRQIPDHPLVRQTIDDCLTEAMDIDGLIEILKKIENQTIECIARDLPEPSPLAQEILNAKPYAFLDNAPLEERRTQAVYTRRAGQPSTDDGLGILDPAAIEKVRSDAWPKAANADEVHEALYLMGVMTQSEVLNLECGSSLPLSDGHSTNKPPEPNCSSESGGKPHALQRNWEWIETLVNEKRAGKLQDLEFWSTAERLPIAQAVYPNNKINPALNAPDSLTKRNWERPEAIRELVRGRMEVIGPVTVGGLADYFHLTQPEINQALIGLEGEGFVLRGKFHSNAKETEWCDRRLLARIHRLTINRLRAEIQPVSMVEYLRFLLAWQRVDAEHQVQGISGLEAVLELFDGYELPAFAWEPSVLALRVKDYNPQWLDQLCFTGQVGWGRLTAPPRSASVPGRSNVASQNGDDPHLPPFSTPSTRNRAYSLVRSSPIALFRRENLPHWLSLAQISINQAVKANLSPDTQQVWEILERGGALYFREIVKQAHLLPSRVEQALGELTAQGCVTSDSFEGLRALLLPQEKRTPFSGAEIKRHHKSITSVENAGRWSLLRRSQNENSDPEQALEHFAWILLRRYGVVFRRLLDRESLKTPWFDLHRIYRKLEARGEIRGGYFVAGVSGEQFALPEAIGLLRSLRKLPAKNELITLSGADPLNLAGIIAPSRKIAALTCNRILLRDGLPLAALEGGQTVSLNGEPIDQDPSLLRALTIGTLSNPLRPYYS